MLSDSVAIKPSSTVIDADRHVCEPTNIWNAYLPKKVPLIECIWKDTPERIVKRSQRYGPEKALPLLPEFHLNGLPVHNGLTEAVQIENTLQNAEFENRITLATTPETQLLSMDEVNIEQAYLFPTLTTFIVNHEGLDAEITRAYAQAYNRWLHDYCAYAPKRLHGVGMISRSAPEKMIEDLMHIAQLGWTSIVLRPEVLKGRSLGHPDYEKFWCCCEETGIAVAIHGSSHLHGPTAGTERFNSRFALHACAHSMEAQMAFLSLLEAGVLERHPTLKFAFLEAGAAWLPAWLWRLDEICYKTMPAEMAGRMTMLPSEYFKRQCWIGFETTEPCLREVVAAVGSDRLLYGTDFPHPDHFQFELNDLYGEQCALTAEEIGLVVEQNPKAFFDK